MKNKLKSIIIEELHLEDMTPETLDDDVTLFGEGLGLDSLDALQLAVAVEEHFGVRIADEQEGKDAFASVNALCAFIGKRQGPSAKSAAE